MPFELGFASRESSASIARNILTLVRTIVAVSTFSLRYIFSLPEAYCFLKHSVNSRCVLLSLAYNESERYLRNVVSHFSRFLLFLRSCLTFWISFLNCFCDNLELPAEAVKVNIRNMKNNNFLIIFSYHQASCLFRQP